MGWRTASAADLSAARVDVQHKDMLTTSLKEASVVFLFLPIGQVAAVLAHVKERVAPRTRVIVHEQ